MKTLSAHRTRISFTVKRIINFFRIFRHSKRGIIGVAVLFSFIIIALAAPLLTPYDPVKSPEVGAPRVAERFAKPIWYTNLFPSEPQSENMQPILNPAFSTADSLKEWEFLTNSSSQSFTRQFVTDMGNNGNGCMAIMFERNQSEIPMGYSEAYVFKKFNYPYPASPLRFTAVFAVFVEGAESVPIKIDAFFQQPGGNTINWWGNTIDWWSKFTSSSTTWITPPPTAPIDSNAPKSWVLQRFGNISLDLANIVFPKAGDYQYGIKITFDDTKLPQGEEVKATVYIDDLDLTFFGSAFGLLGTDQQGRDIFTQLVYGTRISLLVGLLSAFLSTTVGLVIGLTAGYIGKWVDQILMRFTDMLLVIPDTPLYIVLMAVLSPSIWTLILLIGIIGWTGFARIVRSQVLSLRERPFVEGAKAIGAGKFHIITRHILPNVVPFIYVTLAMSVPNAIIAEAWLSWLGLFDPNTMTWGRMLHDAENIAGGITKWWWVVPPGLSIAAISLSFILLGYALDEILNPKLRERQ